MPVDLEKGSRYASSSAARSARPNEITVRSPAARAGTAERLKSYPERRPDTRRRSDSVRSKRQLSIVFYRFSLGDFLGFAGQPCDIETSAYAVAAIAQSAIIHVGIVAGDIERGVRDAIDHRRAGLREFC